MNLDTKLNEAKGYKIREFEWFEVETKIRLFVQRLLEPTLKQVHEDRVIVDQISQQIKVTNKELDMLTNIVLYQGAGIPIFEEFGKKFTEIELNFNQIENKRINDKAETEQQLTGMKHEIDRIYQISQDISKIKQTLEQDFVDMQKTNQDFRKSIELVIQNLSQELLTNFSWNRQQISKIEQNFNTNDLRVADVNNNIKSIYQKISLVEQDQVSVSFAVTQISSRIDQMQMFMHNLNGEQAKYNRLEGLLQNSRNKIQSIEQYLTLYAPIYTQSQINETLFACMPTNIVQKLMNFERQKLDHFDQKILDSNGKEDVTLLIEQHQSIMEEILKRTDKMIQQTKAKELRSSRSQIEESQSSSESESQKTSRPPSPMKRRMTNLVMDFGLNEQQQQQTRELIESFEKKIDDQLNQLKNYVQIQLKDHSEQQFVNTVMYQKQIETQLSLVHKELVTLSQPKQQPPIVVQDDQSAVKMQQILSIMLNFLVLVTHLMIQDEIDRQGMQLMGAKDNHDEGSVFTAAGRKNKLIQLQGECLSCSGQPIQLLQQFKLACLAYNPSDITVEGKTYKRDQLLDMLTKLLQQAKKDLNNTQGHEIKNTIIQQQSSTARSQSIPVQINRKPIRLSQKAKKLAPMTNFHDL